MNYEGEAYLSIKWNTTDRFLIEKAMFVSGGYKTVGKSTYGNGKVHHFKEAMKALLPHLKWHAWVDLEVECFINYREIGIAGPASSGKTYIIAACVYTYIQIFPKDTSVIMSTTTVQALQLRIWGSIKEIHNEAKRRRSWLPGTVMESRCSLAFEHVADEARDFRDGLIGVACFAHGALIDTPTGKVPIEQVKVGDSVLNAVGVGKVTETHVNIAKTLYRVTLNDGRFLDCTEEHPFLTQRGWVPAIDLETFDRVFSHHETVRIMRKESRRHVPKREVLFGVLPGPFSATELRPVRNAVLPVETAKAEGKGQGAFLLKNLCVSLGRWASRKLSLPGSGSMQELREDDSRGPQEQDVLLCGVSQSTADSQLPRVRDGVHFNTGVAIEAEEHLLREILQAECDSEDSTQESAGSNPGGSFAFEGVSRGEVELSGQEREPKQVRETNELQAGPRVSGVEAGRGDRWRDPSDTRNKRSRREENQAAGIAWVDSVEVLKQAGFDGHFQRQEGDTVYNLSVAGHPSYSVNGIIVHNCRVGGTWVGISGYVGLKNDRIILVADEAHLMDRGFLNAIANLRKGSKKEPFKLIAMGNPKDTSDALGTVCEPRAEDGGWEGYTGESRTQTWLTRAEGGIAIQLCGYDTPNGDATKGNEPFPGLILKEDIENDANYYGRESIEFTMMNLGIFPRNSIDKRVITVTLCETSQAFEEVTWESKHTLKRAVGVDAAYSGVGGDRCVLTDLTWGQDTSGEIVMAFTCKPIVIPVNPRLKDQPEDQIALFMKEYCDREGISLSSVGIDSTGKGTLVAAIGRLWGTDVIPVEFGGKPTERIVQQRDNKRACDAYGKFVTELWFAARSAIVGRQIRKMPMEVAREGATRAWDYTKGMKQDVEPKEYTKERLGRSPDLFDSFVVALEVARRNGFEIANTQAVGVRVKTRRSNWLMRAVEKAKQAKHELVYQ